MSDEGASVIKGTFAAELAPVVTHRRDEERDGDSVVIEMEGPPITRCQSRYSWNVKCVKPPHGPDDPWHTDGGAFHWHTDAEVAP